MIGEFRDSGLVGFGVLIPPPGQGRWMQSAERMRAETEAYPAMRSALFALLDSFTQHARTS